MCQGSFYCVSTRKTELHWKTVSLTALPADGRLALMEMKCTLARLIWHFDIALKEGQEEPAYDHITISAGKLQVRVKPRHNL